jgi:type II restriction enzyme
MDLISLFNESNYLLTDINEFLEGVKRKFYDAKQKEGKSENEIRQAWVSFMGHNLEGIFELFLKAFCNKHNLKLTKDKWLRKKELPKELSEVKRKISVNFGKYMLLPDADLIIYKTNPVEILFIFSIKNSFRERYTETPYWKLKLLQDDVTKHIKVFLITPDKDNEISFDKPKKARIVLEYELDGIYLAKDVFDKSEKIKSIMDLIDDLERYLKEFNERLKNY